jgi:hypothetical protein
MQVNVVTCLLPKTLFPAVVFSKICTSKELLLLWACDAPSRNVFYCQKIRRKGG